MKDGENSPLWVWLFNKLTEYPPNTWVGFKRIIPLGLLLTFIIDYFLILPFCEKYLFTTTSSINRYIVLGTLSVIILYIFYFLIQRSLININVLLSKKVNIVLAYNLESVLSLNEEKFQKKYASFVKKLEYYIRINDLQKSIKLIVAPPDTKLSGSTAEAKTKLGLLGSTLLVWGDVIVENKTHSFRTRFSYEFGHNKNIPIDRAKKDATKYIGSLTNGKLFSPIKNKFFYFEENLLLVCLFILGFSTLTLGNFEKSKLLFEAFREHLKSSNMITQSDFSQINKEVKKFLVFLYSNEISHFWVFDTVLKNKDKIIENCLKILALDPENYEANIRMAFVSELEGNRVLALKYNETAGNIAKRYDYTHLFNNAYFALTDGFFSEAIEIYDSIPKNGQDVHTLTSEVSNFMSRKFNSTNELGFLFADGYISYLWDDKIRGAKTLKEFIKKARAPNFNTLVEEAKRVMQK